MEEKHEMEVFLQGPGMARLALIKVPADGKVQDLIEIAKEKGLKLEDGQTLQVWVEDKDDPLTPDQPLKIAGIQSRSRVQVHTCPRIHVTVNFQSRSEDHPFSPVATIRTIKQWADKKYGLSEVDASEYALQVCGTSDRPADDIQVGSLVQPGQCQVCFDLVAKQRVEG